MNFENLQQNKIDRLADEELANSFERNKNLDERNVDEDIEQQINFTIEKIYKQKENGENWKENIINNLENYFSEDVLTRKECNEFINQLQEVITKEKFIAKFKELFTPIISVIVAQKNEKSEKFIQVNEVLSYKISDDKKIVHIHIVPSREQIIQKNRDTIKKLKESFQQGLQGLAIILKSEEDVEYVTATSKMVKNNPKLIQKLGFENMGMIDKNMWQEHFSGESQEDIHFARISREVFLEKYLNKVE